MQFFITSLIISSLILWAAFHDFFGHAGRCRATVVLWLGGRKRASPCWQLLCGPACSAHPSTTAWAAPQAQTTYVSRSVLGSSPWKGEDTGVCTQRVHLVDLFLGDVYLIVFGLQFLTCSFGSAEGFLAYEKPKTKP